MNRKKFVATFMACLLAMSITSCKKDDGSASSETKQAGQTTNAETSVVSSSTENNIEMTSVTSGEVEQGNPEESIPYCYRDILNNANSIVDAVEAGTFNPEEYEGEGYLGIMEEAQALKQLMGDDANVKDNIGFALKDLDGNGVKELIIASPVDNGSVDYESVTYKAGYSVLAIYTMDGEDAVLMCEAWSRNSWFISSDGDLINEGSGGAASHLITKYVVGDDKGSLTSKYSVYSEYDTYSEDVVFFESIDGAEATKLDTNDFAIFDSLREELVGTPMKLELTSIGNII